jgi:hypothetical protein
MHNHNRSNTMATYTVFCREAGSFGTTWIDHVQAADPYEAAEKGKEQCAEDWGWDDSDGISVLGVLRGEPTVEFWND